MSRFFDKQPIQRLFHTHAVGAGSITSGRDLHPEKRNNGRLAGEKISLPNPFRLSALIQRPFIPTLPPCFFIGGILGKVILSIALNFVNRLSSGLHAGFDGSHRQSNERTHSSHRRDEQAN
jgi:hypothetical protein